MMKWVIYYLLFQVTVIVIFWMISKRKDKRYKSGNLNLTEGFEPTKEISIDPVTLVVTRVYIHPDTGERIYIVENEK